MDRWCIESRMGKVFKETPINGKDKIMGKEDNP